ncbi:hypothetical protein SAMN05720487_12226 [Fibrobacter sp. UWT2]|uniref:hypothetical protein n=1 Tax=Fibrobacter sp. UWT2 TaxID=1896224 RepID=UPI0009236668|nr:hypothetical protein [Fibrobacter sp. UWT2]SHL70137.1 hypothetical protein SAMN05720487_12226 [Fibrobacter sp. UWT2]
MSNLFKVVLLFSCVLFAQVVPAPVDSLSQEDDEEETAKEHHLIYYDYELFFGDQYYLDGKPVDDLSEIREILLANENSRHSAKVSNVLMGVAYVFGGVAGFLLGYGLIQDPPYRNYMLIGSAASFTIGVVGAGISSNYLEKAIDEYW